MCPKRFFNYVQRNDLNRPLDMSTGKNCSWCDITISDNTTINLQDAAQSNKLFCSEKCFESSRRASFKKTKMCDWCDKMSISDNGVKSGSDYSSTSRTSFKSESLDIIENRTIQTVDHLQFCNESCLNNYKQTYFVKETVEVLHVKKEKLVASIDKLDTQNRPKNPIIFEPTASPTFCNNSISATKPTKQLYKSPKIMRSTTIPKMQRSTRKLNLTTPSMVQKMNNLCQLNINPLFNPLNVFSEFVNPCSNSAIPNFPIPIPIPKTTENVKLLPTGPIYIPIPIPIPIPIFKNAPEILEILHQYGYKQSKLSNSDNNNSKSSSSPILQSSNIISTTTSEPQTEALDLSGSFDPIPDNFSTKTNRNIPSSFPIASILQLNDPYLKRRNRILDAQPTSVSGTLNHQIATAKNFSLNYTELLSSSQLKTGKLSKRKVDRSSALQKSVSHSTQVPKQIVHTAKSLLRRYPLISLRRNIKSAPSSVLDSNNKTKNLSD